MVLHRHVYIVFSPNLPTAILKIPNCLVFKSQMANIPKMLIVIGLLRKKTLSTLFLHKPEHKHKIIYILILISFQTNYYIQCRKIYFSVPGIKPRDEDSTVDSKQNCCSKTCLIKL